MLPLEPTSTSLQASALTIKESQLSISAIYEAPCFCDTARRLQNLFTQLYHRFIVAGEYYKDPGWSSRPQIHGDASIII